MGHRSLERELRRENLAKILEVTVSEYKNQQRDHCGGGK